MKSIGIVPARVSSQIISWNSQLRAPLSCLPTAWTGRWFESSPWHHCPSRWHTFSV